MTPDALAPGDRCALRTLSAHGETGAWTLAHAIGGGREEALKAGRRLVALGLAEERLVPDGRGQFPAFALTGAGRAAVAEGSVNDRGPATLCRQVIDHLSEKTACHAGQ